MNSNEMQSAWNSPRNNLPTDEQRTVAEQFSRQMIRRRRFHVVWLINTFVALAVTTAFAFRAVAVGKVNPGQEWALLPLLIVPWLFALHFLRRHLKPVSLPARGELPITESLRTALGSNRTEQSQLKLVVGLFAIMIPLVAVSMKQLQATGKVLPNELDSMAVFFGSVLLLSSAGIAARYFGRLLPQQKRLEALLEELADESRR